MVQGQKVGMQACWMIFRMIALHLDISKIIAYSGYSKRTIERIKQRFRLTGNPSLPKVPKHDPLLRCPKKSLSLEDVLVCYRSAPLLETDTLCTVYQTKCLAQARHLSSRVGRRSQGYTRNDIQHNLSLASPEGHGILTQEGMAWFRLIYFIDSFSLDLKDGN
jgi:hypothetical protein